MVGLQTYTWRQVGSSYYVGLDVTNHCIVAKGNEAPGYTELKRIVATKFTPLISQGKSEAQRRAELPNTM